MTAMPTPLANQLLIALPALADTNFSRSVALICQHDDDGAMGIVVNRASEYTLGEVLGQMGVEGGDEGLRAQIVLAGGPVHPDRHIRPPVRNKGRGRPECRAPHGRHRLHAPRPLAGR